MANRTVKEAHTIKGTNPQFLVEKIIRHRIHDSKYWKESCFALSAELVVDRGSELRFVGGIYAGNVKPTPFICLTLKMLQIQPDKEIAIEFIRQEEYKYIRALGAMYIRLTFNSVEIYKYLEPLYNDYRKIRYMNKDGRFELVYMDEFIDNLLREERYCDIMLPRLQKREALEDIKELDPYKSLLDEDLDKMSASDDSDNERRDRKKEKPRLISRRRSRSRDRERGDRERDRKRDRSRERDRDTRDTRDTRDHRDMRDTRDSRDTRDIRDRREDRHRDRSRERDRDRRDHHDRDNKDKERDRHHNKKSSKDDSEREINEANELRHKLGLAPLER